MPDRSSPPLAEAEGWVEITPQAGVPRSRWLVAGGLLLIYTGCFALGVRQAERRAVVLPAASVAVEKPASPPIIVHVAGRVRRPGLYRLPAQARIADAIRAAGGAAPGANPHALNLAALVEDGGKLEVPTRVAPALAPPRLATLPSMPAADAEGEVAAFAPPQRIVAAAAGAAPRTRTTPATSRPRRSTARPRASFRSPSGLPRQALATTPAGEPSANAAREYLVENPLDLNHATLEELQVLPRVGPRMAEKIIAWRTENGPFKTVDQLDEVPGIGPKTLELLRDLVVIK